MNIKYIAAGVLVLCLAPAVYYSMNESRKAESGPAQSDNGPILDPPRDAPSQQRNAGAANGSAEEVEERRVEARIEAIEALENSQDPKALNALGNALGDPNRDVKDAALQALSERKGAHITEMLRLGLADPDPGFRMDVLEAIAERGDLESLRRARTDPLNE